MPAELPAGIVPENPRSRRFRIGMAGGIPTNPPLNRGQSCRCRGSLQISAWSTSPIWQRLAARRSRITILGVSCPRRAISSGNSGSYCHPIAMQRCRTIWAPFGLHFLETTRERPEFVGSIDHPRADKPAAKIVRVMECRPTERRDFGRI